MNTICVACAITHCLFHGSGPITLITLVSFMKAVQLHYLIFFIVSFIVIGVMWFEPVINSINSIHWCYRSFTYEYENVKLNFHLSLIYLFYLLFEKRVMQEHGVKIKLWCYSWTLHQFININSLIRFLMCTSIYFFRRIKSCLVLSLPVNLHLLNVSLS